MNASEYERVKTDFLSGRIKGCNSFFEDNGCLLEAGYCCLMLDKLDKAQKHFLALNGRDDRAEWALFLLCMIQDSVKTGPTYFQIRNFLEIDLNLLMLYCKGEYIEKIIKYADFMAYYNPESYKFIGRVFWANDFMPAAKLFLRKAKDKFYQDPELHYLLAYIAYYEDKDINQCKKALSACLEMLPEYAPANKLLKLINNNTVQN